LYANDTKECDNVYSNAKFNEQISKYRIAVKDLALAVDMKKKSTDFKVEFSVRTTLFSINHIAINDNKMHSLLPFRECFYPRRIFYSVINVI